MWLDFGVMLVCFLLQKFCFYNTRLKIWQGLSDRAVNTFSIMTAEGLKPSILALNSLINAFSEDRREAEAFAVLKFMKENVLPLYLFSQVHSFLLLSTCVFGLNVVLIQAYFGIHDCRVLSLT